MLGWLWSFSLLWLALTDQVRAGSRVHQTRPKGIQRVWSVVTPTENIQIQDTLIKILQTIILDVQEAKIQRNMLSSRQSLSRDEYSGNENQTRSMSGPYRKREGIKKNSDKDVKVKTVCAQR